MLERFLNVVFPYLGEDEAVFMSLSSRVKYLTEEERQVMSIGRNEMFRRRWFTMDNHFLDFITKVTNYLSDIKVVDGGLASYTDKDNNPLPLHSITVYLNINPSDMRKAVFTLQREILDMIEKGGDFRQIQSKLNTVVQKSRGTRRWTDIDVDVDGKSLPEIIDFFQTHLRDPLVIHTHSGYHVMISNQNMKKDKTNLGSVIQRANENFGHIASEIVINKNAMVPLPGTYQGGEEVCWYG